jgi:phage terminase large subunit-like protein
VPSFDGYYIFMNDQHQQIHLQDLIDLLAEETEKYTRAFISGKVNDIAHHKAVIDALVVEIKRRKQEGGSSPHIDSPIAESNSSEASS